MILINTNSIEFKKTKPKKPFIFLTNDIIDGWSNVRSVAFNESIKEINHDDASILFELMKHVVADVARVIANSPHGRVAENHGRL